MLPGVPATEIFTSFAKFRCYFAVFLQLKFTDWPSKKTTRLQNHQKFPIFISWYTQRCRIMTIIVSLWRLPTTIVSKLGFQRKCDWSVQSFCCRLILVLPLPIPSTWTKMPRFPSLRLSTLCICNREYISVMLANTQWHWHGGQWWAQIRKYRIIYRKPGFLDVVRFGSFSTPF
jgi:hypothetical protein